MIGQRLRSAGRYAPAAVALGLIALGTYRLAENDFHYQLAGQADPFLGHPSPVFTCILGVLLSLLLVGGTAVARHLWQSPHSAAPAVAWRMEWLLVAGWVGYAAGTGVVLAAGGPAVTRGSIRYELGAPLNAVSVVDATCTSVVGDTGTTARVTPSVDGVLAIDVRSEVNGTGLPLSVWTQRSGSPAAQPEPLPVPERPAISESLEGVGNTIERHLSFTDVYDYQLVHRSDGARSGEVELAATRQPLIDSPPLRYVNAHIPNDPWPSEFRLVLRWSCEQAGNRE